MYIEFKYKNHRGEVANRMVRFESITYIAEPGYGYKAGWFLNGFCIDKDARRSFSLDKIVRPDGAQHYSIVNAAEM